MLMFTFEINYRYSIHNTSIRFSTVRGVEGEPRRLFYAELERYSSQVSLISTNREKNSFNHLITNTFH